VTKQPKESETFSRWEDPLLFYLNLILSFHTNKGEYMDLSPYISMVSADDLLLPS